MVQYAQLRPGRQFIMHKVHGPGFVRPVALRRSSRSSVLTRGLGVLLRNCRPNSR